MVKAIFIVAFLMLPAPFAPAQQDPNDPGNQDSLLFETLSPEVASDSVAFDIFAFVDDSIILIDVPVEWHARLKGFGLRRVVISELISKWDTMVTVDSSANRVRIQAHGIASPIYGDCERVPLFKLIFNIGSSVPGYAIAVGRIWAENEPQPLFGLPDNIVFRPAAMGNACQLPAIGFFCEYNWPDIFGGTLGRTMEFKIAADMIVKHELFDIYGECIFELQTELLAGYHNFVFTGRDSAGQWLTTGTYLYRVTAGDSVWIKKMAMW